MLASKTCRKCGQEKVLSAFAKDSSARDGLQLHCKECNAAYRKANRDKIMEYKAEYAAKNFKELRADGRERYARNREENIAKVKAYSQSPAGKEMNRRRYRRRKANETVKIAARTMVGNAIRMGQLVRGSCEGCGAPNAEAHHDSYAPKDWLKVRWLCPDHHRQWHNENGAARNLPFRPRASIITPPETPRDMTPYRKRKVKLPGRMEARDAVNNALKIGTMTKKPCEVCGEIEVEAHHLSYEPEQWLNVQWLCQQHHTKIHLKKKD